MNKEYYSKNLEQLINLYETDEVLPIQERMTRLQNLISAARDYNIRYKNPYKHYFMNKPIKFSNEVILALEEILKSAENLIDNNEPL